MCTRMCLDFALILSAQFRHLLYDKIATDKTIKKSVTAFQVAFAIKSKTLENDTYCGNIVTIVEKHIRVLFVT